MRKSIRLVDSPVLLCFAMHKLSKDWDTEQVAELFDAEINQKYKDMLEYHCIGLLFGKYDLLLECKPVSNQKLKEFVKCFRKWLWNLEIGGVAINGCVSNLTCFRVDYGEENTNHVCSKINTYSFFRPSSVKMREVAKGLERISRNKREDVRQTLFWNPSAISYTLKASGDNFSEIFDYLYDLRKKISARDFCTFATLRWDANDRDCKYIGLSSMINIKLSTKTLSDTILKRFDKTRVRLGYFDLVREVACDNLSGAFDAIKETRSFLSEEVTEKEASRTATVLTFDTKTLKSSN